MIFFLIFMVTLLIENMAIGKDFLYPQMALYWPHDALYWHYSGYLPFSIQHWLVWLNYRWVMSVIYRWSGQVLNGMLIAVLFIAYLRGK